MALTRDLQICSSTTAKIVLGTCRFLGVAFAWISDLTAHPSTALCRTRPVMAGLVPSDRYSHTCSAVGTQLILFGGFNVDSNTWLSDLHVLDTGMRPTSRHRGLALQLMIIISGVLYLLFAEWVQPYHPSLSTSKTPLPLLMWFQPEVTGDVPAPRAGHTASVVGSKIYVYVLSLTR